MTTVSLDAITLSVGRHRDAQQGMCLLEAVSYIAGEPFSDHPRCVCPTLAVFGRSWNDALDDETRQRLKAYIPRMIGTSGDGNELRRSWMCFDWLTRVCAPAWMDLSKTLRPHAAALRAMTEITDRRTLEAVMPTLREAQEASVAARSAARFAAMEAAMSAAREAAWDAGWVAARSAAMFAGWVAARSAAWDAGMSAAREAAWDAGWVAAREAAWDAAREAAWDAGWVAAREAAWDAGWVALTPTRRSLQESAFGLLDRMLSLDAAI